MRLIFCGTPDFAGRTLEAVLAVGHEVALVVTQPDRAAGRGMELLAPAVKRLAVERGLPVVQPEKIRANEVLRARMEEIRPDAVLVVAYGRIIPPWMLELPRFGCLNLHGSLLPKYRGAAPIQWAVAKGETVTGVTTMRLDAGLDTGPMLLAEAVPIGAEETAEDVYRALAEVGSELMVETLRRLEAGDLEAVAQDEAEASLAPILTREDGRVLFRERPAKEISDRWRGFTPWPGAWTTFRGKRFLLLRVRVAEGPVGLAVGEIGTGGELRVGCAGGTELVMEEVQMEGKPRFAGVEFARAFQVKAGERLG